MKKIINLLLLLFHMATIYAIKSIEINSINYNLNTDLLTAEVTTGDYYGSIAIPKTVNYRGKTYTVTAIGDSAFAFTGNSYAVDLPNSITYIGKSAFQDCRFSKISLPNSVVTIGEKAFFYTNIKEVYIPSSVSAIGDGAFNYCNNLEKIIVDGNNNNYCSVDGILYSKDKSVLYAYPATKTAQTFIISNSVKRIASYAFKCSRFKSITIPNSIEEIGENAFASSSLESVSLSHAILQIDRLAFFDCQKLTQIIVDKSNPNYCSVDGVLFNKSKTELYAYPLNNPSKTYTVPSSVTTIGEYAFAYAPFLETVNLPNSLRSIKSSAFQSCAKLTKIEIPNNVKNIEGWAFYRCLALKEVILPDSLGNISEGMFLSCQSLKDIKIPSSVKIIEKQAFTWCSSLISIVIPSQVVTINEHAFSYCHGIEKIICEAQDPPILGKDVFYKAGEYKSLYVPNGTVASYKDADQWNKFSIYTASGRF